MRKLLMMTLGLLGVASAASSTLYKPTLFTSGEFGVQLSLEPNPSGDKVKGVSSIHYAYSSTAAAGTYRMVLTDVRTRKVLLEKTGKLSFHLKKGVKVQDTLIKSKLVPDGGKVCLSLTLEVQSPTLERLSPSTPFTLCQ